MYHTFIIIIGVIAVAVAAVIVTKLNSLIATLQDAESRSQQVAQELRQLHADTGRASAQGLASVENMRAALVQHFSESLAIERERLAVMRAWAGTLADPADEQPTTDDDPADDGQPQPAAAQNPSPSPAPETAVQQGEAVAEMLNQ